jgi:hypothetical protein
MKKILIVLIYTLTCLVIAFDSSLAQTKSSIHLGAGVLYSPEFETTGQKITALFEVTPHVSFTTNFINYSNTASGGLSSARGLSINTHYKFLDDADFNFYALGGGKVYQNKFINASSNTDYGLNIGGGFIYYYQKFSFFSGVKYIIQSRNNFSVEAGIRYQIN